MANRHVIHAHSSVVTDGKPLLPLAERIRNGEIAVNYAKGHETLSIKNANDEIVTFSSDNSSKLIPITYSDLVDLVDNAQLIPGQLYRITDYVTTTVQENTQSAGHQFDLIVLAIDTNMLSNDAKATHHDGDSYFDDAELEELELKYTLINDSERFAWADTTNGKGVIYYMKDKWGNECPYDFKNIQFKRWAVTNVTSLNMDADSLTELQNTLIYEEGIEEGTVAQHVRYSFSENTWTNTQTSVITDSNDYGWYYTFSWSVDGDDYRLDCSNIWNGLERNAYNGTYDNVILPCCENKKFVLNNIVFINTYAFNNGVCPYCIGNKVGSNCSFMTFGDNCFYNIIRGKTYDTIFGCNCAYNKCGGNSTENIFGKSCGRNNLMKGASKNTLSKNCNDNHIGEMSSGNVFGRDCISNTLGVDCGGNIFSYICENNTFGNECHSNTLGNNCKYNIFGNVCQTNAFTSDCKQNIFGNECSNNELGNGCDRNVFANKCSNNIFGSDCDVNTFDSNCRNNTFGNQCINNKLGNTCLYNIFGANCENNIFGNSCGKGDDDVNAIIYKNTLGSGCKGNIFGNECYGNTLGETIDNILVGSCSYNTFGNNCENNTFSNECVSNTFGNNINDNSFGRGFSNNSFGNDCSYNTFGRNCQWNTFGNHFGQSGNGNANTFGDDCSANTFGNNCYGNTLNDSCVSNFMGNTSKYNTFGNACTDNTFENVNTNNTLGDNCRSCTLRNDSGHNTIAANCESISFGENCQYVEIVKPYTECVIVDNGNQFLKITSTQTPTKDSKLQNIKVDMGFAHNINDSSYKTISHNSLGNNYVTIYQSNNSSVVTQ